MYAQECDCINQYDFVRNYYESNNPAFQKIKSNKANYKSYLNDSKKISVEIKKVQSNSLCSSFLDKYIALLKDHHSSLGYNLKQLPFNTFDEVQKFKESANYKRYTIMEIDTAQLFKSLFGKTKSEIEGIYTNGGSLEFGIIKKEKSKNEYLGIVLRNTRLLEIGHVLLELRQIGKDVYVCKYNIGLLGFNFPIITKDVEITNGQIPYFGFSKIVTSARKTNIETAYEFKQLDENTNYLRLSSFDRSLTKELDSLYNEIDSELRRRPYLIIDIRDNEGGDEQSYINLIPYIYTNPMKIDPVLVWVTPENIKRYEEVGFSEKLIERMHAAKSFSFISQVEGSMSTWKFDTITTYPRKVALLFNRRTASSAESMITYCIQSSKVITIGENTGGYLGYGNVMTKEIPCGQFNLRSTTTMYHTNAKYEFVGIEPMHKANENLDWVKYAQTLFSETK